MARDTREVKPRPDAADPPRPNGRDRTPAPERQRTPAEIRQDIQRTRAEIDRTLDELGHELQPKRMLWHARKEIEPEVRAAADRVKENPKPLLAAGAAALGLFALRALVKRRKTNKRSFPEEQKGI